MKNTKRLLAFLLCIILTTALLASCKKPDPDPVETDEISETNEILETTEPEDTDPQETDDIEVPPEPSAAYDWVVEPSAVEGNIRPVYDVMDGKIMPLDVCLIVKNTGESLIGYDGKIKTDLPSEGYSYCSVCGYITNHYYGVDINNAYELIEGVYGHGGSIYTPYIYDKDTGKLFYSEMGEYFPAYDISRAIVSVSAKRNLTQDEIDSGYYSTDYTYENTDGFGVLINGELVLDGFDAYTPYSNGVIALQKDGKWGYYDDLGKELFGCEYDSADVERYFGGSPDTTTIPYHATEGVILLNKGGSWAFADVKGNLLTDFDFDEARPVINGKAWVKTADGWGVIELPYYYTVDEALENEDSTSLHGYMS